MKKQVIAFARTNLVQCGLDCSTSEIARTMKEHSVGSVILTGPDGSPEGLVTDKNIFAMIAEGINPLEARPQDYMEKLEFVKADEEVLGVLAMMEKENLSRVGIKNKEGKLVGLVSRKKLKFEQLRILKEELGIQD